MTTTADDNLISLDELATVLRTWQGPPAPRERSQTGTRVSRPVVVALIAALAALALVPIGGASLGARALSGISSLWTQGHLPPAPAPYQPGDKVWTTTPPSAGSSQSSPPAGYTAPQPPAAPPAYKPGGKVWTTTPPTAQTTTTITCTKPTDAAKALAELEKAGSLITSVECR